MELENSQNNALAKLPMLKLGEYEMWEIRIKQYFQIQDYALWEVIENGNSWVPIPVTAPESGPSTALKMTVPSTAEEKICKKNDVKARSLLLMALPNEHQLTFNQVNHANQFVPKPVQLNAGRPKINSVRPNTNTGRTNVNSVRPRVSTVSSDVNTVRSRQPVPTRTSNSFSPKRPQDHPLKKMEDIGLFDSGCSGHMTSNKDHLYDFEECKGGYVTFGGSKGYITGKGRIRVGNLDFDSVSFVKELGHFNLFSISQICDKQHKVLFTESECLVVSPDFKMPDEHQILLKVPRQHNMYIFDMKTPSLTKDYACLIAKATSDESKLMIFLVKLDDTVL
ncbi:hypothetical protein Tco_0018605 [Tanacetum coccineum]